MNKVMFFLFFFIVESLLIYDIRYITEMQKKFAEILKNLFFIMFINENVIVVEELFSIII